MKAIKTIKIRTKQANKGRDKILRELINDWRRLVKFFLEKCFEHNAISRGKLHRVAYKVSKNIVPEGKWNSKYRYTAMNTALSIYKSWKKLNGKNGTKKSPEIKKLFLKLYRETNGKGVYKLIEKNGKWFIKVSTSPRNHIVLPLIVSNYQRKFLEMWKRGKIVLGEAYLKRNSDGSYEVHIAVKREEREKNFHRRLGVDINEGNVTISVLDENRVIYATQIDVSELSRLDYVYKMVRIRKLQKKFYRGHRPEGIPRKKIAIIRRYAKRWSSRKNHLVHNLAKYIVALATTFQARIVMEDMKNIKSRILNRGRKLNRRLALADFRKLQEFIEYKATWIGVPVVYIDPRKTSRICPICGLSVTGFSPREPFCERYKIIWDRDFLASINIALRDVARDVRAEVPMKWISRRRVSANEVSIEGKICAMKSRYSYK